MDALLPPLSPPPSPPLKQRISTDKKRAYDRVFAADRRTAEKQHIKELEDKVQQLEQACTTYSDSLMKLKYNNTELNNQLENIIDRHNEQLINNQKEIDRLNAKVSDLMYQNNCLTQRAQDLSNTLDMKTQQQQPQQRLHTQTNIQQNNIQQNNIQ
eukprot:TRINITY_DN2283_c0_g1_i4.p1 TRINITY_DN2283_c0_g1~~TRINITY_DN2283_c0_g1_i4.p1  ORF type:complete len:156 (+),score=37.88 TRINITY_DN2283_c0_g1_i4:51-518(+)